MLEFVVLAAIDFDPTVCLQPGYDLAVLVSIVGITAALCAKYCAFLSECQPNRAAATPVTS
jgi:hypothetical protein